MRLKISSCWAVTLRGVGCGNQLGESLSPAAQFGGRLCCGGVLLGFGEKLGGLLQQFDMFAHIAFDSGDRGGPGLHWAVAIHRVFSHAHDAMVRACPGWRRV